LTPYSGRAKKNPLSVCFEREVGMTRRPDRTEPEPPGGRAAERLRQFIAQRFPGGLPPERKPREEAADEDRADENGEERDAADPKDSQTR
jgi:hypothetical protein